MTEFERIADGIEELMFNGLICPLQATASCRRVRGIARLVDGNRVSRSVGLIMALAEEQRANVPPLGDMDLPFIPFMLPIEDGRPLLLEHSNA